VRRDCPQADGRRRRRRRRRPWRRRQWGPPSAVVVLLVDAAAAMEMLDKQRREWSQAEGKGWRQSFRRERRRQRLWLRRGDIFSSLGFFPTVFTRLHGLGLPPTTTAEVAATGTSATSTGGTSAKRLFYVAFLFCHTASACLFACLSTSRMNNLSGRRVRETGRRWRLLSRRGIFGPGKTRDDVSPGRGGGSRKRCRRGRHSL